MVAGAAGATVALEVGVSAQDPVPAFDAQRRAAVVEVAHDGREHFMQIVGTNRRPSRWW
jgi:predicted HAD superfamily Cof-like phosphohydrolase